MFRIIGKICGRGFRLMLEAIAAVIGIAVVVLGLVIWRAGSGPITIDTIAPELAALLSNPAAGVRTEIGHALLMWDREAQALRLVGKTIKVTDQQGGILAELPQLSLGLNFLAPLRGQGAPFEIFSNDFTIRLLRTADGSFHFGLLQLDAPAENPAAASAVDLRDYLHALLQIKTGWIGLGQIGAVRFKRMTVLISDQIMRQNWNVSIPYLDLTRRHKGLIAKTWIETGAAGKGGILLDADYQRKTQTLFLRGQFSNLNPAFLADKIQPLRWLAAGDIALNGMIAARLNDAMQLQHLQITMTGKSGRLLLPELLPQPVPVTALALQAEADFVSRHIAVRNAALDVDGIKISLDAEASPGNPAQPDLLQLNGRAAITDWPLDRLGDIWPERLAPNARAWIAQHMSAGRFTEVAAAINLKTDWNNPAEVSDFKLKGGIKLDNATIKYIEGMPPVTGVSGVAEADQSTLKINIKSGKAGHVVFGPSPIVIDGLDGDAQNITLDLTGRNKISDVLHLIDSPPLHYAKAVGLEPGQVSGMADLNVRLGFPLLKNFPMAQMQIAAQAKIKDFASDKLLRGLAITDGAVDLAVDAARLTVKGQATYNGVMMTTHYRQEFAAPATPDAKALQSEAVLTGAVAAEQWAALGLDPGGMVKGGAAPVTIKYSKGFAVPARLDVAADFTPADLHLDMFNWRKVALAPAAAKIRLVFGAPQGGVKLAQFSLTGPQLNVNADGLLEAGTLRPKTVSCRPCVIGRTDIQAAVKFAEGAPQDIDISGAALDYRPPKTAQRAESAAGPLRLKLDVGKLYQGDEHFFANAGLTAQRDFHGWNLIDFRGLAEGRTPVTITLLPDGDKAPLRLTAATDDCGDLLRALNLTGEVHGGKLLIMGNSTFQYPRRIEGEIRLRKYKVKKLPFLAVLLNAASFTGFVDMLGGEGIGFDRLEGKYIWDGDRLELEDMRTAGGALGLNLDGAVDFAAHQGDFRGAVAPFSFFNKIIGNIPLVGDILTGGGGGGVFAVTYHAEGDLDNLKFNVNPVSALAPGILRRIFFQGK